MKNDVTIKANSYCPICKGVVLADCRHDSIQFSVPMRYQRMEFNAQLQNEVEKLTVQRDELEKLCNYNERVMRDCLRLAEEAPRWRDVVDELPQEAQEVLFVRGGKTVHGAWIGGVFWHSNQQMAAATWMPLPKPPAESKLATAVKMARGGDAPIPFKRW